MSQETVMKFFEAVAKDEAVTRRLHSVGENVDEFADLSADLGRQRGFAFEPSDVRAAITSWLARQPRELDDRALAALSGGAGLVSTYSAAQGYLSSFGLSSTGGGTTGVRPPGPRPGGTGG